MIPLVDLVAQYHAIKSEIDSAIQSVLESGKFILGPQEQIFETEVASYLGVKHAIGVASGTDALIIALRALGIGPGDEVIIPAYTFFATAGCVLSVGATPVFVDIDPRTYLIDTNLIEQVVTERTKAIIPVHLYGQPADMNEILALAQRHHIKVIEDNAQAFGAEYRGEKTGAIGDIGCLSFFPSKNLGGYGDGGMITTNDDRIADLARMLRVHGWKKKYYPEVLGYNSRLDEIQAAILRVKLRHIDDWNNKRRDIAHYYNEALGRVGIITPNKAADRKHVYHLYVIRLENRAEVRTSLMERGVSSEIYYPQPLHLANPCVSLGWNEGSLPESERASQETLAIPLYPELAHSQVEYIINKLGSIFHL